MGRAPHEPASVTARACSVSLEGELIRCITQRIGLPRGSLNPQRPYEGQHEVVRGSPLPYDATLVSQMRVSFQDNRRCGVLPCNEFYRQFLMLLCARVGSCRVL